MERQLPNALHLIRAQYLSARRVFNEKPECVRKTERHEGGAKDMCVDQHLLEQRGHNGNVRL